MNAILRLYPKAWRDRYGDEMAALLEERPNGPFDWLDLMLGALDAQLHSRDLGRGSLEGKDTAMSLRIGAGAAIVGGAAWIITLIVAISSGSDISGASFAMLLFSAAAVFVAIVGLSAFQYRSHRMTVWASVIVSGGGVLLLFLGLIGQLAVGDEPWLAGIYPWYFTIFGMIVGLAGCLVFGIATFLTRALSRRAAALLIAGVVVQLVGALGTDPFGKGPLLAAGAVVFGLSWILFGLEATRPQTVRAASQPA